MAHDLLAPSHMALGSALLAYVAKDIIQWIRLRRNGGNSAFIKVELAKLSTKVDSVIDRLDRQEKRLDRVIEHGER